MLNCNIITLKPMFAFRMTVKMCQYDFGHISSIKRPNLLLKRTSLWFVSKGLRQGIMGSLTHMKAKEMSERGFNYAMMDSAL